MLSTSTKHLRAGAAALAACALALGAAACGGSSHSAPGPAASRPPLQSIFEADLDLRSTPGPTLATLRGLGVSRVKVFISWRAIAPDPTADRPPAGFAATNPGAYPASAWAPYDAIIRDAQRLGVAVDLTVGQPAPQWATGTGAPPGPPGVWKPSATQFGQFMRAVGTRYSGSYRPAGGSPLPRVSFWGIWNEPNYGPDLAPQAIGSTVELSPALYRGLIDSAWSALHATGHGSDTILIGELAPRGQTFPGQPGNYSGMVPLRFVRALYCVDAQFKRLSGSAAVARGCPASGSATSFAAAHPALFHASGFSVHPYPQGRVAPNVATTIEPDYADMAALPNLEHTLDRAQSAYGSFPPLPLYSTEFGYKTDPPYAAGAPLATAALFLNWAEYISWRDPRIRSYDQYLLVDPPANANSSFVTGLEFSNHTAKPTLAAFRMPVYLPSPRVAKGTPVPVWGCVRPAPYAARDTGHVQTAAIEYAATPAGPFRTLDRVTLTDPDGYFEVPVKVPASGVIRISFNPPRGPAIHSRLAAVTIG